MKGRCLDSEENTFSLSRTQRGLRGECINHLSVLASHMIPKPRLYSSSISSLSEPTLHFGIDVHENMIVVDNVEVVADRSLSS